MTSTIEEKSNRVVEVLLAAVSPMELMAGKLLGQLGVGLTVLAVYLGLGLLALFQFAMLGLVEPMLVIYVLAFFFISYLVFGALMMAIGAAVNTTAEAQAMMGPVMLLLIAPYVLSAIVGRAPNSTFSVVASFVPPINTFVMMARLASDAPPPTWQVLLTMVVGLGAAAAHDLVRRQGLQDRPADARQAAHVRHPGPLGPSSVGARPRSGPPAEAGAAQRAARAGRVPRSGPAI